VKRLQAVLALAGLFFLAGNTPAFADSSIGFRTGLALSPNMFIGGVHFRTNPLNENLYFVPSVEGGVGDATMIAGNADLQYQFKTSSKLRPYAGGGITLNWFHDNGEDETDFGGSLLGGISLGETSLGKMFLEGKLGLGNVPDVKIVVGWNLR
jgi:hypothetical protein